MTGSRLPMQMILAHSGHWLVSLLYVAPVLGLAVLLAVQVWRDRRRAENGPAGVDDPAD